MSSSGNDHGAGGELVPYKVGYGRPPAATRFRPGQSGNPRGRPRKSRLPDHFPKLNEERLKQVTLQEAYRKITIRDGDRTVDLTMAEAVIRSIGLNAAKGDKRSQKMFTELLRTVEMENKALYDEYLKTMIEYKSAGEKEIERCKRLGIDPPEMLPHPDHIHIDMRTGEAVVRGPFTRDEKKIWDGAREFKEDIGEEIDRLKKMLKAEPGNKNLQKALRQNLGIQKRMAQLLGE
ncbi:MAG: hypothetical protein H5U13_09310 [Parvibaculum sp.]|nr:hypothetical protein [Parvibaculum sp.]